MRRMFVILLAVLMVMPVFAGVAASAEAGEAKMLSCPEMGFSVPSTTEFDTKYVEGDGLYVYTSSYGSIPYVLIFKSDSVLEDPASYIHESLSPRIEEKYGDDFAGMVEYEYYTIGGKDLPGAKYTYRLQGYVVDMLRLYEVLDDCTVTYTAKYVQSESKATLQELDLIVSGITLDGEDTEDGYPAPKPEDGASLGSYTVTAKAPIVSGTAEYSDGRFSITLPKGWQIVTAGEYMTFSFKAWDPSNPNRTIFMCFKIEPFLKSQAAKEKYQEVGRTYGGTYVYFGDCPVLEYLTVPCFLKSIPELKTFCSNYFMDGLALNPSVIPDMTEVEVVETMESSIPCAPTCPDNSIARISYLDPLGQPCEGLVTAQPTDMGSYDFFGLDGWVYTVYEFMGVTAPMGEMEELEAILVECLSSFDFEESYVKKAIDLSNEETQALLARGRAMQAAHDAMVDAWYAREAAHDIAFQKWSDAFMGYDRLYDSYTGEVYLADTSFYDGYDLNRGDYSNPNLQIVDSTTEGYYLQGVDYYINK